MRGILSAATVMLAACNPPPPSVDQCMRATLFERCMTLLPAGPTTAQYNDWDEVVEACDRSAYYQALRQPQHIKSECK